jgi:hypothetical protein
MADRASKGKEKMKLPIASYSFLNTWSTCAHQAARRYIIKDLPKEPESPEMKWGNEVHKAMEWRLKGEAELTLEMPYEPFAAALDGRGVKPEQMLGITSGGKPVDFWDGSTWLRGKLDAPVVDGPTALLLDWKTGKVREDPYELEIGALLLQAKHPKIKTIVGRYVWLKENRLGETHDCSDTQRTFNFVHDTMDEVEHAIKMEKFDKTPGPLCGWCPVTDCSHNRRAK